MKKFLSFIFVFIFALGIFTSVSCKGNGDKNEFSFYTPDGAPALSVAKFIYDGENFIDGKTVKYNVVSSSAIGGKMQSGEGDFIIIPVNAFSKLYKANADDPYKILSVITHGNLYLASKENLSLSDLKGKVVGVIGEGLVTDLTFKTVLKNNGIEYETGDTAKENKVVIRYFSDASNLMPMLKQGTLTVGLLPEPAVSKLSKIAPEYAYRQNLQTLYDGELKSYPQAVLCVKQSVLKENQKMIKAIKDKFSDNYSWTKENVASAVSAINSALDEGITPSLTAENITSEIIENCNIFWKDGKESKEYVNSYLQRIINVEENSARIIDGGYFI